MNCQVDANDCASPVYPAVAVASRPDESGFNVNVCACCARKVDNRSKRLAVEPVAGWSKESYES